MEKISQQSIVRSFGIAGILGGIILFIGDMLIFYSPTETNLIINMSTVSNTRIIASGVCALFSSWFYLLGAFHVSYAFNSSKLIAKNIILFCLGGIGIAYGIVHAEYIAIATSAKLSAEYQLNMQSAIALAVQANQILRMIIYPLFAILSFVFINNVLRKKTLYSNWILLFYPLIPFLIQNIISNNLTGKWKVIIAGGYLNLILIIFYTASTINLWNKFKSKDK